MKFAVCGNLFNVEQISKIFTDIEIVYELTLGAPQTGGATLVKILPQLNFFEFRRLIDSHKLDGLLLNMDARSAQAQDIIKKCKLYGVHNVGLLYENPFRPIYFLNTYKSFMPYAETNLIDSCNLNCEGCTHYANLFGDDDFYKMEIFERDMYLLSATVDVVTLRLMGGEPFKLPNLADYLKIARKYFPQSDLRLVTNALLIPAASQDLLDAIRENNFAVNITLYPPTEKIREKVEKILMENKIFFRYDKKVNSFLVFLTLHGGHDPEKARKVCINDICRFIRNGKVYKCPIDALSYKFVEKFGIKGFPESTGVNIGAPNFSTLLETLNGNVECCYWCNETVRQIQWKPSNKPNLEEWLANPMETLSLCSLSK